ncbi:hypothetical protein ACICHK_00560 [Streptomyces sp. AHU1]|uniref:hypothetical protein n=1 Tax=Streptomyces sp. AHU1 TaxID=3377215 RepID=UPI003877EA22
MASLRTRSILVAAAFITGATLLTACGSSSDGASSAGTASAASAQAAAGDQSDPASPVATASAPAASGKSTSNPSGSGSSSGESGSGSSGSGSGSSTTTEGINSGKGVNGQWHGIVRYMAPGKFTVSDLKDQEQQFFVSDSTAIWSAGTVCAQGKECTEAQLETAAKKGFEADVKINNGIATEVREG